MEAKDIFEANSKNVRELLSERGLGLYIPPYQRPYGWDKEKVSKLLSDVFHGFAKLLESQESYTFLGTLITIHDINFTTVQPAVRTELPGKLLTVIDGQQRLTSLLALCMALHNQTRVCHAKFLKKVGAEALSLEGAWLDGQARKTLDELESTLFERSSYGDSPIYPRMIRSFSDQWARSKVNARYHSPIANLIFTYVAGIDGKPRHFRPFRRDVSIEGDAALVDRFSQIMRALKSVIEGEVIDEADEFPALGEIAESEKFQQALLNHCFPVEVKSVLVSGGAQEEFCKLLTLILLSSYVLGRVALTAVRGKNEDFAFSIFESLNTTGEPLTAFETFKPRVVMAESLGGYERSNSRIFLDAISAYLSQAGVGEPLQNATRDLLISFAAAETGYKLSKRLADQRRYLKEEYERYETDKIARESFVRHLRDVALFVESAWDCELKAISLSELPVFATTDAIKLCLAFLRSIKHSVTIAPLVRFYAKALNAPKGDEAALKEFEGAVKAVAAFSALWRASRRGTANIDKHYREILLGSDCRTTSMPPLARSLRRGSVPEAVQPVVELNLLKAELRARLAHPEMGGIANPADFVREAASIPAYSNSREVARFILLAAYHDAVEDSSAQGLITKGKALSSPCLTFDGFCHDRNFSLEHIAPQDKVVGGGWGGDIYESKESVHRIGNLVLIPKVENSSLSSRAWAEKKVMYQALGAFSKQDAESILDNAKKTSGIEFGASTQEIISNSNHLPQVLAIGRRSGDWDMKFVEQRSERVLQLAWDELYAWLN